MVPFVRKPAAACTAVRAGRQPARSGRPGAAPKNAAAGPS